MTPHFELRLPPPIQATVHMRHQDLVGEHQQDEIVTHQLLSGVLHEARRRGVKYEAQPHEFGTVRYTAKVQVLDHDTILNMLYDAYNAGVVDRGKGDKVLDALKRINDITKAEL